MSSTLVTSLVTELSSLSFLQALAMIITTTVVLSASYLFYLIFIYFPYLSPLRHIPGPPVDSLLTGHYSTINKHLPTDAHLAWAQQYGPIVKFRYLLSERILVTDPELIKQVFVTNVYNYVRPAITAEALGRVVGYGLLTAEGEEHAKMRKLINPAFHFANIKSFVEMFNNCANILAAKWANALENAEANNAEQIKESAQEIAKDEKLKAAINNNNNNNKPIRAPEDTALVNVHVDLTKLTMDVIGRAAFGYNFRGQENEGREMFDVFSDLIAIGKHSWKVFLPLARHIPFAENIAFAKAAQRVNEVVGQVILDKKSVPLNTETPDLLDLLLSIRDENTGEGISDQELRDQVKTFMFAGHETTSITMTWVLYALANHQEIQNRLRREVSNLDFNDISLDKLDKLPYLSAVIQETLRLYPPVPTNSRIPIEDDMFNGVLIPKGTTVHLCAGVNHRLEKYWQDPLEFKPDRFLSVADGGTGESAKVHKMNYLPFSHGPRMCIGHRFATVEMKAVLSVLINKFEFFMPENSPPISKKITFTMRPYPDLRLGVRLATNSDNKTKK